MPTPARRHLLLTPPRDPHARGELPELAQALAEGDELAVAREEVWALKQQLAVAAATERTLRNEARALRQELTAQVRRFGWLECATAEAEAAREAAVAERDAVSHS